MRYPGSSRGKTPSHCQACREAHPVDAWCDYHHRWHPLSEFTPAHSRPRGRRNVCTEAVSIQESEARGHLFITCAVCLRDLPSHRFRGGRAKAPACKECEAAHSPLRYCPDCAHWMAVEQFTEQANSNGRGWYMTRCRPCRAARSHGVTVATMLARQGATRPECAACGTTRALKVDHDHACCPGSNGCERCVRGWLCHSCNTAEGLLRTPERARALARYMDQVASDTAATDAA